MGVIVNKLASVLLLLVCVSALGGCSVFAPEWRARHGREHSLVGRIYDVNDARFIDRDELMAKLAAAEFVLLGERHDHPDHHRLQAEIVGGLLERGRRPAVGFEVFDIDDGPAIERHLRDHPRDADGIAEVVQWNESGWSPWKFYRPIVRRAVAAELPVVAVNLSRAELRELGRAASDSELENSRPASEATLASLRESEAGRKILELGLDRPIDPATNEAIADSIRATHCGHAPEKRIPAMILAQRARDAQMAEVLVNPERPDGLVLIAGAGHVRLDRAVPYYLRLRLPEARVVSLSFLEVRDGKATPAEYAEVAGTATLPFDVVWFTPRVSKEDPCETFRKALEKMAETSPDAHEAEASTPGDAR
jgi:uncharacterized iron-regulated protein